MKFVDEMTLHACSGSGGNGVVRWLTARGRPKGGPAGGDGGDGGDVYVRAVRDIALLSRYRGSNKFIASDGGDGGENSLHGKNGEDKIIDLPLGSVVTISSTGEQIELTTEGKQIKVLTGGRGGYGNEHFKGSRNVTPQEQTNGKSGVCSDLNVELKLIADLGLVGFPNAGKSSLLNSLTRANVKVGNYEFTTLNPNLGVMHGGYILADIPGLIEGASEGKGLGDKFLRHIIRTNTLLHCISVERESIKKAYSAVRAELGAYDKKLLEKQEVIILTKSDLAPPDELETLEEEAKSLCSIVFTVSVLSDSSVKNLQDNLTNLLFNT